VHAPRLRAVCLLHMLQHRVPFHQQQLQQQQAWGGGGDLLLSEATQMAEAWGVPTEAGETSCVVM
jgi:hypothetical protein